MLPESVPSEYGILMLKPDGVRAGLQFDLSSALSHHSVEIVRRERVSLTAADVFNHFLHPTDDYISYLLESPVEVFLVRGIDPHRVIYELKQNIRIQHRCLDKMRNLVHGADEGNEFHSMLHRFFPDLEASHYCSSVDLSAGSASLASTSALRCVGLDNGSQGSSSFYSCVVRNCTLPDEVSLLMLAHRSKDPGPIEGMTMDRLKALRSPRRYIYINSLPIPQNDLSVYRQIILQFKTSRKKALRDEQIRGLRVTQVVDRLVSQGIDGLMCFRPDFKLIECELRMDIARLSGLYRGGCSAGIVPTGHFSVSWKHAKEIEQVWTTGQHDHF